MESAADALDFDDYVAEKKRETVSLHFCLVVLTDKTARGIVKQVGNQDGFEAYRRLAIRYAPRTLGRNLTRLTLIIDHDFGSDESQMLDKIAAWDDLGYPSWSNKGKGKDSKGKGQKGDKGKGDKNSWWNNGGKGGKGKSNAKGHKGKGQGKQQGGGNAEHFAGYCGKCGLWGHKLRDKQKNCRRQANAVEEEQTEVGHLSATDSTTWIHT
eukprot:4447179-Amphidinium_carterae.1